MDKKDKKTERLNIRMTKEEKDAFVSDAKKNGMTVTNYLRWLAWNDLSRVSDTK